MRTTSWEFPNVKAFTTWLSVFNVTICINFKTIVSIASRLRNVSWARIKRLRKCLQSLKSFRRKYNLNDILTSVELTSWIILQSVYSCLHLQQTYKLNKVNFHIESIFSYAEICNAEWKQNSKFKFSNLVNFNIVMKKQDKYLRKYFSSFSGRRSNKVLNESFELTTTENLQWNKKIK